MSSTNSQIFGLQEINFTPPDNNRSGGDDDQNGGKKKKLKGVKKGPKKSLSPSTVAPPVSAIIVEAKDSVYAIVWEQKKQLVRDALINRFGIHEEGKGKTYIEGVVNGITNTGLFEDITNRGIGSIYSNLSSGHQDILDQLVIQGGFRVMTFEEQLRYYANYAVRRSLMPQEKLEEYIHFLREEVYFAPSAKEYDIHVAAVNALLDEMRTLPTPERKQEIFALLLEKSEYISKSVIRKK